MFLKPLLAGLPPLNFITYSKLTVLKILKFVQTRLVNTQWAAHELREQQDEDKNADKCASPRQTQQQQATGAGRTHLRRQPGHGNTQGGVHTKVQQGV